MRAHELPKITQTSEIYLDMDGVLADFFAGYQRHNPSVKKPSDIMSAKDDPTIGKLVGTDFFNTLPKFKSANALIDTVLTFVDHYNICSSPLRNDKENSELNKRKWIGMHLSPKPRDIIITSMKETYAKQKDGSPNILIDDKPSNINRWNAAGGIGILYDAYEDSPQLVHETLRNVFSEGLGGELNEYRRNPENNPRIKGHEAAVQYLKSLKDITKVGVSMTNLPKLGINPKSTYATPIGVYFYPAVYYLKMLEGQNDLPFQHEAPYIQIFSFEWADVLELQRLDRHDYDDIINDLANNFGEDPDEVYEISENAKNGEANVHTPGGWLWYVTYVLSNNNSKRWNKILHKLGYDVVLDLGDDIIHENESYQGVVINPRVINHIEQFEQEYNRGNVHKDIEQSYQDFISRKHRLPKAISDYIAKKDPLKAFSYARHILKGRFPEAESEIIKYPRLAAKYAIEVLGHRWPEAEHIIRQDYDWWNQYRLEFRIPESEDTLDEGWKDWAKTAALSAALAGGSAQAADVPSTPTTSQSTQTRDADEPVPSGYRLMTLPNGRDVAIPDKYSDEEALQLITKRYPDLVKPLVSTPKKPPKLERTKVTPEDMEKAKEVLSSDNAKILIKTAKKYGLHGTELAQFLAQCAHESLNFAVLHEIGGKKYFNMYDPQFSPEKAKELGNIEAGDGAKFKGRGFLHITGRYNYAQASQALGLPLEQHPELLEKPNVAAAASVWFWNERVKPRVDNFNDTMQVTKPINKGLLGLQKRHDAFSTMKPIIKKG